MTSRALFEWSASQNAGVVDRENGMLKVRVLNDFYLWVSANDVSLTPSLVTYGFWESWISVWFSRNIRPGDTVVDVGANFGYYTMLAERCAGAEGRVVAYEANPDLTALLERTKFDNEAQFEIRNVACADKPGIMTLSYPGDYTGSASLMIDFENSEYGEAHHMEVEAVRLDDEGLGHIDLLKIDAESAEEIVWNGTRNILYGNHPPTVVLEYSPTGTYSEEFIEELLCYGTINRINFDGALEPVDRGWLDALTDWDMLVLERK